MPTNGNGNGQEPPEPDEKKRAQAELRRKAAKEMAALGATPEQVDAALKHSARVVEAQQAGGEQSARAVVTAAGRSLNELAALLVTRADHREDVRRVFAKLDDEEIAILLATMAAVFWDGHRLAQAQAQGLVAP